MAVIDIEAAHDPLATAVDGLHPGCQRQRHAGPGLAIRPQCQQLHGQRLADRHPALGPHADLHGSRPALHTATQGLDLTVRIGIAAFHRQRLRTGGGGQRQRQQAMALRIQHERKPVGHQMIIRTTGCLRGVRVLSGVLIVPLRPRRGSPGGRLEVEGLIPGKLGRPILQHGRYLHRHGGSRATGHVVQLHVHPGILPGHQHIGLVVACGGPDQYRAPVDGQAEFLHPEGAAFQLDPLVLAGQRDPILPQPCTRRNGEVAFGTAPAGGGAAPGQRLGEALIAAHMRDDQRVRQAVGKPEPPGVISTSASIGRTRSGSGHPDLGICQSQSFLGPDEMLHRERLASAQQRAIHDRMRMHLRLARAGRGDIETPRLDALLPAAPDKAHVLHAMILGPGADEVARHAAAAVIVLSTFPGERLQTREAGHPLGIGRGFCLQLPIAVRDPNPGIGHRPPLVQRRHPGQAPVASLLEMHPQVRHQHRGAHIHRAPVPIAGIQQGLAQLTGGHFQHMEAGRQGNAQDLEGTNIALRHVRKRL